MGASAATSPYPSLVERDGELRIIAEHLSEPSAHGALLIAGEPGIGKTALLNAAAQVARGPGLRVLRATGRPRGDSVSFGVLRDLLGEPLETVRPRQGAAAHALSVLRSPPDGPMPHGDARAQMLHGLVWLVEHMCVDQPTLLLIDDLQWADEESAALAVRLAGAEVQGLRLVTAIRAGEARSVALTADLLDAGARSVTPTALTAPGSALLVRERLPGATTAFCDACHHATAGNPYLLRALCAHLFDQGIPPDDAGARTVADSAPGAVADHVARRMGRLPADAAALAEAFAILAGPQRLETAAALATLTPGAAAAAAFTLAEHGLLRPGPLSAWVHPLAEAAAYARIEPERRSDLHRAAAHAIRSTGGTATAAAAHLLMCDPVGDPAIVEALLDAARAARQDGSPAAACRLLRRALDEPARGDVRHTVLLELGQAQAAHGDPAAPRTLIDAVDAAGSIGQRAEATIALCRALWGFGRLAEVVRYADECLREAGLPAGADAELEAIAISAGKLEADHRARALERLDRVLARDRPLAGLAERVLLAEAAFERAAVVDHGQSAVIDLARRALDGGRLLREETSDGMGWFWAAYALILSDDMAGGLAVLDAAVADGQARGSARGFGLASSLRCGPNHELGRLHEAAADAEAVLDTTAAGLELFETAVRGTLMIVRWRLGDAAGAEAAVTLRDESAWDGIVPHMLFLRGRGWLRLQQGRLEEAERDLRTAGAIQMKGGGSNPAQMAWRSTLASVLTARGQHEEAHALAAQELALAERFGSDGPIGRALRAVAEVEGPAGLDTCAAAIEHLRRGSRRPDLIEGLCELGGRLHRSGHDADARRVLREALDGAHHMGAAQMVPRARALLVQAGGRPRRAAATGPAALTPTERRTAEMVAQGLTNREIAEARFVTLKAVEWHITNAYRKLGARSRAELGAAVTAAAAPSGPPAPAR